MKKKPRAAPNTAAPPRPPPSPAASAVVLLLLLSLLLLVVSESAVDCACGTEVPAELEAEVAGVVEGSADVVPSVLRGWAVKASVVLV